MGLNLSNKQISQALDLNKDDMHRMTRDLGQAMVEKQPVIQLKGQVECDEVYVTAGHKGQPAAVKKGRKGRRRKRKEARGRGTLATEKPPIFGMINAMAMWSFGCCPMFSKRRLPPSSKRRSPLVP
jgi:hypothetical protein